MVAVRRRKKVRATTGDVVIGTEKVPTLSLNPYYRNPRRGDVEKVAESLKENGQFKPIVVNKGTLTGRPNEILAGNHTWLGIRKLGWEKTLVSWVDIGEGPAKKIVVADNAAGDDSTYDNEELLAILGEVKDEFGTLEGTTFTDDILGKLIASEEDPNSSIDKIEDAPENLEGVADLGNDVIFMPSRHDYDIPELREDMLLEDVPQPLDVYAGIELDGKEVREDYDETWWLAMWHAGSRGINWKQAIPMFYTEDFHFYNVFTEPAKNTKKILNLGITTAIMPNYSIGHNWPVATWVWAVYRSFYVARYFQEAGIKVIPDIQYGTDDEVIDLSLLAIPEGAPVCSVQIQNARGDTNYIRRTARVLKEAEKRVQFENLIVYGHTDAEAVLERADLECNIVRVAARTARRREYLNSESTINSQQVATKGKRRRIKR